ncbi:unnamed protein product, partial [Brassica oleracea var. botrytis]
MPIIIIDDSFKRPGTVPFSWEIRPGVPKTPPGNTPLLQLQPPNYLSPLRLKPLSHSQPFLPPALSPPSSSFISKSKSRSLSPLAPSFSTPSKLKPPPRSHSGFYSSGPSFRSTPRAFSERWQLNRTNRILTRSESDPRPDFAFAGLGCFPTPKFRLRKNKSGGGLRKTGSRLERGYCSYMETMSPRTVSNRRSVSLRWDSPKSSSFSSLRFSPRLANEAEWAGLFFISPRSIGRQKGFRHRSPLKQRNLREESAWRRLEVLVLGPGAYIDPKKASLGLQKATEFFFWIETHFGFQHNEITFRDMACLFAKGNDFKGEEGLVKEALATFYRMKEYHCKPDVYAYNTIINALCRVGNFKKARYGMQTGCRKAIRRRMWEANRMFREMLFRGFAPDVVTYNCLIDGCCKTNRIGRALELFEDMKKRECVPNQVTYNSFIRYYSVTNEIERGIEMMRMMEKIGHGVAGSSTYTPLIHALVETRRVAEARDSVVEMVEAGLVPREYTYKLVLDALSSEGVEGRLDEEVHKRMRE